MAVIVISDVCETLFRCNTTFDFVAYVLRERRKDLRAVLLGLVVHRLSPLRLAIIALNRLGGVDHFKSIAAWSLRGFKAKDLEQLASDFFRSYLSSRTVGETESILLDRQRNGYRVILASSSLEPVVSAIARHYGFEHVAARMKFRNGAATGRLMEDITGRKLSALVYIPGRCCSLIMPVHLNCRLIHTKPHLRLPK